MRRTPSRARSLLAAIAAGSLVPMSAQAASHREAPVTSLDRSADITDFFAFVSPDKPGHLTSIMCTDPLLEPANGPNYFPFDPSLIYEINVDNNHDAKADVTFQFRFRTEVRAPAVPVGFIGAGGGIPAPADSPPPIPAGAALVPPEITALDGAGAAGLSLRQTYTVTVLRPGIAPRLLTRAGGLKLFAVPSNVGERTMPFYKTDLYDDGDFEVTNGLNKIKVWAGTADDPFAIDLGAAFDSLNFRAPAPVLTAAQDADDDTNINPDDVSGYNVNCIAMQAHFAQLTFDSKWPTSSKKQIGLWATTSRLKYTTRNAGVDNYDSGTAVQIQRMANPLVNELLIGTGDKNKWSGAPPSGDATFAAALLDPLIVRVVNAVFGLPVPTTDVVPPIAIVRNDLKAALLQYTESPPGPVADLLRVDLTVPARPANEVKRLGACAGDEAGFPNGRRLGDDVTDCFLRVGMGLLIPTFAAGVPPLGDGVNKNDFDFEPVFPYLAPAQSGRSSRHIDPGEPGCGPTLTDVCPD